MSQGKRNRGSIKAASRAVANSNLGSWDKFMHHLFEMESFVKPAWKLQTGRQKVGTVIERFDIFPYEEPKRLRTSEKSGFIALSAIVLMTVMFFPELYNFFDGQIFLNVLPQPSHRSFASERMQLPRLIITPGASSVLNKKPYHWNESYYRVEFSQRVIHFSDSIPSMPREKYIIPSRKCEQEIHMGSGYSVEGWCPSVEESELREATVLGTYAQRQYRYVTADVVPCYVYGEYDNGTAIGEKTPSGKLKCAPKSIIDDLFYNKYATFGYYIEQVADTKTRLTEWKSATYVTIAPQTWTGIESFLRPFKHVQYDLYGVMKTAYTYMLFESNEARVSSPKINSEILRFYIRMGEESTLETATVYTIAQLLTSMGGLYTVIFGVAQYIGVYYNKGKHRLIESAKREYRAAILKEKMESFTPEVEPAPPSLYGPGNDSAEAEEQSRYVFAPGAGGGGGEEEATESFCTTLPEVFRSRRSSLWMLEKEIVEDDKSIAKLPPIQSRLVNDEEFPTEQLVKVKLPPIKSRVSPSNHVV
jgi:hypothetical protein